jgi:CheY-like chemotaxis protein
MDKLLLVVDDSRTIRRAVEMAFRATEFSVVLAQGADDALVCIQDRVPDVVFVDAKMEGIDGYELCKQLKAREDLSETPVLLMVDEAGPDEARAEDVDIDGYVIKPFICSDLIDPARMLTGGVVKHDVPLSFEQVLAARRLQARQDSMPSARVRRDGEADEDGTGRPDREVDAAMADFDALESGEGASAAEPSRRPESPHAAAADLDVPGGAAARATPTPAPVEAPKPIVQRSRSKDLPRPTKTLPPLRRSQDGDKPAPPSPSSAGVPSFPPPTSPLAASAPASTPLSATSTTPETTAYPSRSALSYEALEANPHAGFGDYDRKEAPAAAASSGPLSDGHTPHDPRASAEPPAKPPEPEIARTEAAPLSVPSEADFEVPPPRFPPPLPSDAAAPSAPSIGTPPGPPRLAPPPPLETPATELEPSFVVEHRSEITLPVETLARVDDPAESARAAAALARAEPPPSEPPETAPDTPSAEVGPEPAPAEGSGAEPATAPEAATPGADGASSSPDLDSSGEAARLRSSAKRADTNRPKRAGSLNRRQDSTSALLIGLVVALALALVALGIVLSRL